MAALAPEAGNLPSYQEATRQADWWEIAAPYVPVVDYTRLCLVSRRVYGHFAPRLWNDPLQMVRLLGLDSNDELSWYLRRFLGRSVKTARMTTRNLVLSLDFRDFASATADFLSDTIEETLNGTLGQLHVLFPSLRCILLDGHPVLHPLALARDISGDAGGRDSPLRLLSIAGCNNVELPTSYFASRYLRNLVYLDVSYLPGSLGVAVAQGSFGHQTLPNLRVLKARGREMDSATAVAITASFRHQLWSLDLSYNAIGNPGLVGVVEWGLPPGRSPPNQSCPPIRFDIEGRLAQPTPGLGSEDYGPFVSVVESQWSAAASHPQRHLVDAPSYEGPEGSSSGAGGGVAELQGMKRSDGTMQKLQDHALAMVHTLAGRAGEMAPGLAHVLSSRPCQGFRGLTHLSVNGNGRLTLAGVERALRASGGILEHFESDMLLMQVPLSTSSSPSSSLASRSSFLRRSSKLYGAVGASYLLRPVVSSNLRSVRMHHSLVTQTPTIMTEGITGLRDTWSAETFLAPRAELAYPGPFAPDMNPRLESLTLTNIPRRSTGHIISRLVRFLELAYEQDHMIKEASASRSRRSPILLRGLRHLRLEFEPDLSEDLETGLDMHGDADDLGGLMDQPSSDFSFFGEWKPEGPREEQHQISGRNVSANTNNNASSSTSEEKGGRIPDFPFDVTQGEHVNHKIEYKSKHHTVPVWVGSGEIGPHSPAVNEYIKNLRVASLRSSSSGVGPATPPQVLAGVPAGSYLFQDAWMAILATGPDNPAAAARSSSKPTRHELAGMRDVVAELKRFRQTERAAGRHWSGRLEVECKASSEYFHSSNFWR